MPELSPQPSINDMRGTTLAQLVARLAALDLTPLLVYRIPSLIDSAALAMAWQWDVLDPSWALASPLGESWDALLAIDALTNIDRLTSINYNAAGASDFDTLRELIQAAVPLHAIRGTPAAILKVIKTLGFPNASILEGQNSWGGSAWPANQGWAVFRVLVNLQGSYAPLPPSFGAGGSIPPVLAVLGTPVAAGVPVQVAAAANFWKNERSWLDSVQFIGYPVVDGISPLPADSLNTILGNLDLISPLPSDFIVASAWPISDIKTIAPQYNSEYYHTGITYGANEPSIVDDGVVVNGQAVSQG
jgi:hypothetical protein